MKKLAGFVLVAALAACGSNDKAKVANVKQEPLAQSKNSAIFNEQFGKLMADYFNLKDNFITEKDSAIRWYAKAIITDANSLNLKELKADSSVVSTAKSYAKDISKEADEINAEKPMTLEMKRGHFQILSDKLFDLARTVKYDNEKVYQQNCPMAFGETGANWLSKSSDIKNPYLPKKMLTCGEVKDSLR